MPPVAETHTSFIPKAPAMETLTRRTTSMSILLVVSVIIFLVSAGAYVGALVYHRILYKEINDECAGNTCGFKAALIRAQSEVRMDLVEDIKRMERKIDLAEQIVHGHTSLVPIFKRLEQTTVRSVQYASFSFGREGVTVSGKAKDYDAVAQQQDLYQKELKGALTSYTLSDFTEEEKGGVTFKAMLVFNPEIIKYSYTASTTPAATATSTATSTTP
ncbi:MAG: hypothetical protein UY68_C0014G0008 [Parcubacteria group bacterium GW2011_GWF2_52_12]|nr:MAG: hypothetical protein UY68_C0014G0008 [Parcubacteria group bacterium GW2011_GWF2_52_12]KKW26639.1 MAG: hypothetical protein UY69_C0019G0019 [Parcubacteria group bacterium GW2011_GWF1_52_5]